MTRTCKNCRHCHYEPGYKITGDYMSVIEIEPAIIFVCRRKPKARRVKPDYWCGKFKQKDEEK